MPNVAIKIFKILPFLFLLSLFSACYHLYPHDEPLPDSYFKDDNKINQNHTNQNQIYHNQPYQKNYQQPNTTPVQYYIPANQLNYHQQYGQQPIYIQQHPNYYPYPYYQGGSAIYSNPYIIPQPVLQQMPQIQDQDQYYKIPNNSQYLDTNH
jgi:hypothetical protein